ncbi:MAG TPA: hypothetical protein VEW03_10930, partial [Longimicrobiaceae bacterium]|nr:hypothetical protein [Longimicrobiaceae bacterium]
RLGWNLKEKAGGVQLKLENGQLVKLRIESAAEISAIAAILKESPVFLNQNGLLVTGPEPVSDDDFKD